MYHECLRGSAHDTENLHARKGNAQESGLLKAIKCARGALGGGWGPRARPHAAPGAPPHSRARWCRTAASSPRPLRPIHAGRTSRSSRSHTRRYRSLARRAYRDRPIAASTEMLPWRGIIRGYIDVYDHPKRPHFAHLRRAPNRA